MSRKAEFLAVVKTIIDKDSNKKAKQSTIELAQELSDVLNTINVKPDTDDFKELKDVFNEQLAEMGKQPIVFSENTLKGIASQFANAISDGIKAGVSSIDGEIAKLTKQRESLLEERDALNKQMKNKTLKEKLSNFNPLTTTPLEVSGDLKEEAIRIRKEFTDAYYELVDFTDDDGKFNTQLEGYEDAVLKAQQKAIQLMRMQKTLALNKDPSLNKQREKYAELIDGEEIEIVGDAFEELDDVFTEQSMRLEDIKITLQDINTKIQELQNKKVDIISDDNKEDVSYILKSLEEIEAAYNRISQKNGKLGKTSTKELNAALDPQQEFLSLTQLYGKYNTASETGADWEKLYNYAVRYVNKFESDLSANKISKDRLPKYTELYDTLKPIANDARESLKLLAEFKPTKSTSTQKQKSTEDIAPALHENNELLKRLLSDKEKSTFYDSKTGRYTPVKIGSENQVENSLDDVIKASKIYDTGIHSHRYKIAAPSVLGEDNDMDTWAKTIEYIKKRSIVAREEVLSFDFSSLTKEDIQNIIMQYKEAASVVQKEFDDIRVNLQIGEKFGSFENFEEALQVRLREELEKIMQQYPGVMSSHAISLSTADASTRKSAANEDAAESARKAADEAERERQANEESADAAERKAKAEREAADARRTELVKQLDEYGVDTKNTDQAQLNLDQREQIHKALVDENLITDEIEEKYLAVNKRLEDRLALLKQIREHEHNINGMPGDGLITNEDDPQVYYEEWFKPFTSDVENIRKSGLFSTEEIEHYNIRLAEMQDYLQSIALEALNNYLINPDEVDDAQKLNEILNQRQKILATVEQFDNPLDSPSSYEEAIKLNQAIKDRINFLQQPRSDTTGETEVEANQKKIKSYEDLLAIVQQYYNLKSKLRSINSNYPDGIDAQDYNPPIRAEMDSIEKLLSSKQINKEVLSVYEALNSDYSINEALQKIANALGIEIPQAARVAEGAVDNLNSELREGQSLMSQTPGSSALTGTGGASSEELQSLQDKNDQLRQEKENAEKDKNAANERANKADAETERLRNELANRDKVDSDKSPSVATPVDTRELESLLGRVTYKVKFEGESPLDNSTAVLETVKSALGNIQVNASADKDAPWAREATLSGVIKNTLENIKSNTAGLSDAIKIAIAKTGEKVKEPVVKDYKKVTKDDYAGSTYFPEKLKTQVSKIEEYRAKLATSGRLTQEMDKQVDDLLEKLRLVKNGPEFSVWSEEFKKLRIDENTIKIFDDFIGKENKNLYQELIDLKKQEYEWEIKLLNAQQGSAEETNARQELEAIQEKIKNHSIVYEDYEQELKLQKMQEEQLRKINELSSKQVDSNNKQKLKEETEVVKELNELYQQLAQAKAMADAETDSILRKPFEDRANQIQSEIYAKEANIDRAKYSQQFDNTQKESYKKQIIEELLELYAKLGEAEAKEDRMSIGNATAQQNKSEMDALYKRIETTQKLIDVNEELQNQFDAAQKTASDKVVAKADKADAVSDDKSFEKLGKQYEKLGKLRAQVQSTGSAVTQEDARQLEEAIKKEQERVSLSKEQTEELKRRLEVARQNELLRQDSIKQQKSFEQQIKDSRNKARLNNVNSAVRTSQDVLNNAITIEGLSPESINRIKELSIEVNKLQNKYTEINDKGGVVSDKDQKDVVNQIANVKKLSSEVNDLVKEYNNMNDDNAKTIGKFNGQLNGASIDEYKRQLTEAVMAATNGKASIKGFDAETKTLTYSLKAGSHEFTNYTAAVRGADGALVSMQKETKRTETFIESLTRKTKEIGTYLISSLSLYDVVNKFRQGIQYVREIDSALVELKKVTDETEETYDRFLNTASKTAGKVGSTIKEIVSSTADWARIGYSMEEAAQLAESTSVLLNVSEFSSIEDATSALTSTLQAFGYVAEDSMHVVDVLNEVGKFVAHR